MGCCNGIGCCRWFCCVFVVFVNIISVIIGILLAILGAILLWGYAVIQSIPGSILESINQRLKPLLGSSFDFKSYYSSMAHITGSAAGVLIGFGVLLIIISCIGCIGACSGNTNCLIIYKVCVGLLLIGQLIVVIIWFADSNVLKRSVQDTLNVQVEKYTGESNANIETVTLNLIQVFAGCCGVNNGSDFDRSKDWNRNYTLKDSNNRTTTFRLKYPVTCCKFNASSFTLVDQYCPYNGTNAVSNYDVGCYNGVFNLVESFCQLNNFFYTLGGLLGLELLLIIGALLIYCAKRQEQEQPKHENQYKMHPMA